MKCMRKCFFLCVVSFAYLAKCQNLESNGHQVPKELEDNSTESEGFVEKIVNRVTFLEWLFGLTSTTDQEEEPAKPEPVISSSCLPCACGMANKKIRIVGGKPTQVLQYPWMAALLYNKRFYCGGSLINSKYVVTAAHCVDGFNKQRITVRLLEHNRNIEDESKTVERKVSRVIRHSGYNDRTFNNDIALLKLSSEVPLNDHIRPVCLPVKGKSYSHHEGLVTGWGVKYQGGATSPILLEVMVPIMSNAECRKTKYGSQRITDNMLCAGFPDGKKDACQGDSGGPLHVVSNTSHELVGVVSWGEGCARPGYPGVYTRVNRYLTWLSRNTADACPCSVKQFNVIPSNIQSPSTPDTHVPEATTTTTTANTTPAPNSAEELTSSVVDDSSITTTEASTIPTTDSPKTNVPIVKKLISSFKNFKN